MYLLPLNYTFKNSYSRDFPGGLVVKTRASTAKGMGLIPGQGTNILHATWYGQKKKKKKKTVNFVMYILIQKVFFK